MDIIPFPLGTCTAQPTEHRKLHRGPVKFTCPHCSTSSQVIFEKMIFRSIDFHCEDCGNSYKITNPAFSPPPSPPKKKK